MYVLAKNNSIVALDAATGAVIWTHAPEPNTTIITNRGINYWESKDRTDRRLLFASNHFLRAIDARTGRSIPSFGNVGAVDLKQGLDRDPSAIRLVQSTTPGRVFEDLLILGSATNQEYGSAPGDILRAVLLLQRRARDSNPQPVSRHLISSQTASHSLTLRKQV